MRLSVAQFDYLAFTRAHWLGNCTRAGMATSETNARPLAVVTGASSGIGYELAKELARRGYDLVVAAEDAEIHPAAREIAELGTNVTPVQVDLATYDGVENFYRTFTASGIPVDVIAINAGVGVGGDFARDTDLEAELNLIALNVTSAVHLAKRVLHDMVPRNQGRILFTSSIAATAPSPFEAVYGASKAFVFSFAEAIRNELKDTAITITALMPGPTETNFFHRADMDNTTVGQSDSKDEAAEVAKEGIDALLAGKDRVVAGSFTNKIFATAGRIAPTAAAQLHRKQAEPKSA